MNQHDHPFPGNILLNVERMDEYDDETRTEVTDPNEANVISSQMTPSVIDFHRPVLDIDFPIAAVPSSTPGHYHLYMDHMMPWEQYEKFLRVCAEVGILEQGYVSVSLERKHTAVRVPWVKKGMAKGEALRGYASEVAAKAMRALRDMRLAKL